MSRLEWLKEDDSNTRYFHLKASSRRVRNSIHGLFDDKGSWCEDHQGIKGVILDYFSDLLSSRSMPLGDMARVPDYLQPYLSQASCNFLDRPFSREEICKALFDMAPLKALSSNGLLALFFQKF